jgi:hypothetical protein
LGNKNSLKSMATWGFFTDVVLALTSGIWYQWPQQDVWLRPISKEDNRKSIPHKIEFSNLISDSLNFFHLQWRCKGGTAWHVLKDITSHIQPIHYRMW